MTYSTQTLRGTATTVIAGCGQSNMLGESSGAAPVPTKAVEGSLWLNGASQSNYGDSNNCSVETLLAPNRRLMKRAVGGTSIQDWITTYQPLILSDATSIGLTPTVLIWIQGEKDARSSATAAAYQGRLDTLIDAFEAAWGDLALIVTPKLNMPNATGYDWWEDVNAAIVANYALRSNAITVETADLESMKQGDGVHGTRPWYDALARRIRAELVSRGL